MTHQYPMTTYLYLDDKLKDCKPAPREPPMPPAAASDVSLPTIHEYDVGAEPQPGPSRISLDTPGASSSTARLNASQLSIHIPARDAPIPSSKFSPESPPTVRTGPSPRSSLQRARDRMSKVVFELRTTSPRSPLASSRKAKEPLLPMQHLHLVEKHNPQLRSVDHDREARRERRRKRTWLLLLIALLLFLLANAVFLDVRVIRVSTPPSVATTSDTNGLSALESHCLTAFAIDAPASPLSYPCSTCLPIIQSTPTSTIAALSATDAQTFRNAQQFCGLKAFFDSANSAGQTCFRGWGWFGDVSFCGWQNVGCDTAGSVISLNMTFPGVPSSIPSQISALDALQGLSMVGNNQIPAGSFPDTFANLTSLSSLDIEHTSIAAPSSILASALKANLTTLTLVNNAAMGDNLPAQLADIPLRSLVIQQQPAASLFPALVASSTLQTSLRLLALPQAALSGALPDLSAFTSLTDLDLASNAFAGPIGALPPALAAFDLSNNTALGGAPPQTLCAVQSCDLRSTGVVQGSGCGQCVFSS